jgi:hypothetical protein
MSNHDLLTFLMLVGSAILVCYVVAETTRAVAKNRVPDTVIDDAGEYVLPDEESALWWRDLERQGYL